MVVVVVAGLPNKASIFGSFPVTVPGTYEDVVVPVPGRPEPVTPDEEVPVPGRPEPVTPEELEELEDEDLPKILLSE
jgi:hypothetical protein